MAKTKEKTNDFPVIEDTPVITEAEALAALNDDAAEEPVVAGEFPVSEHPTVDEAREMFEGNPGLAEVLTDRGVVRRVDILGGKKLGLDGLYR